MTSPLVYLSLLSLFLGEYFKILDLLQQDIACGIDLK